MTKRPVQKVLDQTVADLLNELMMNKSSGYLAQLQLSGTYRETFLSIIRGRKEAKAMRKWRKSFDDYYANYGYKSESRFKIALHYSLFARLAAHVIRNIPNYPFIVFERIKSLWFRILFGPSLPPLY